MRVGLLTGGGDAPGLNGIIEATSRILLRNNVEVVGILDGFLGIYEGRTKSLTLQDIENVHSEAGTLLGTTNKSGTKGREEEFLKKFQALKLDGLVAVGGDGTFSGLKPFEKEIPLMGVPKTIDNDISGTEITFGFDTACSVVADSVDALRATANAHNRTLIVEAMGRTAGWMALGGGLSSYADVILIPERPFKKPDLVQFIKNKKSRNQRGLLVVVAEGAHAENENPEVLFTVPGSPQAERYGGIAQSLARFIEKETGWESRHVVLGHLQRAKHPTTTDRFLTLSMGVKVANMVLEKSWGNAVAYRDGKVIAVPISDLMGPARLVPSDHRWVQMAQQLGIFV
ncbi:MAG: ATP-dependent 6-phosphofructokinase [Bdellovibrionales bacterium]|nr:ATP-dependent 6-phosphofructokinase [Bdellovibrionales bacterium]